MLGSHCVVSVGDGSELGCRGRVVRRIFHINSYYETNSVHFEALSALDRLGYSQTVYVPLSKNGKSSYGRELQVGNATVSLVYCFEKWHRFFWPYKVFRMLQGLRKALNAESVDLVHAHTVVTNGVLALWIKWRNKIPYVVTLRNTDTDFFFKRSWFFRVLGWLILKESSAIILLSPVYEKEQLPKYFSLRNFSWLYKKCVVIPSGVSDDWHLNPGRVRTARKSTLVFVGKLDANKNLDLVIDALKILQARGVALSLNVVGDGPELQRLQDKSCLLPVCFYGRVNDNERLREILRESDVLIVPSFRETFGLVYVEAMTQGLPVIYTAGQGFDGFFAEGHVGFSVDPNDAGSLADRLEDVFDDYQTMSANALKESAVFSWSKVAERLGEVYQKGGALAAL